jgi:cobalamin biosynthesis Mg chelatase CobN
VFALLAFLCLPAFALAEDSSEVEYRDDPPTVTGKQSDGSHASSSGDGGAKSGGSKSSTAPGDSAGEPAGESSQEGAGAAAGGGGDGKGGSGGKPGDDGPAGKSDVGSGKPLATPGQASISHDSGGSPLVPILIALAVLAAISIAVVVVRRRRQGTPGGSTVSPEAG